MFWDYQQVRGFVFGILTKILMVLHMDAEGF